jgi:hypothetical protein
MKVPFFGNLPLLAGSAFLAILIFFVLIIVVPGFFIWLGMKFLGKDVGVIRCGIANFIAIVFASVLSYLLYPTPLFFFIPLISFVAYFYAMKSLLKVSFIEAFAATLIASVIIIVLSGLMIFFFGFPVPKTLPRIHF